tara:strand:+ start:350 stop:952 length:603 start_codon:yes stop_codon:yes gene_type:complete
MKAVIKTSKLLKEFELRHQPIVITVNEFNEKAAREFTSKMSAAHSTGQKVIPVIIDSYGGEVYSLMKMISAIRHSNLPVATVVEGKAMSCGAVLFTFGEEGMRYMDPDATVMIHDVSSMAWGKIAELKADVAEAERLNEKIFTMMARNCGKPDEFFLKKLKKKDRADWYLDGKKCKKYNMANHLRVPTINIDISVKIEME